MANQDIENAIIELMDRELTAYLADMEALENKLNEHEPRADSTTS